MNSRDQIYFWAHMLDESINMSENKQTYLAKYSDKQDVENVVNKFQELRHRTKAPFNDIDYWINLPFEDLKDFIDSFDTRNKQQKRNDKILNDIYDSGAQKLDVIDGFEVWYVPNYDANVLIGRNYKNRPTKWCTSSDDPSFWFENHNESEFIYLVREKLLNDDYDKVAIEFIDGGRSFSLDKIKVWDLNDNDEYDDEIITYDLIHQCWILFKQNGETRQDNEYYE